MRQLREPICLLILAACTPATTPAPIIGATPAADQVPRVRLLVVDKHAVAFVTTSPSGLEVQSKIAIPSTVKHLAWNGDDPVMMFEIDGMSEMMEAENGAADPITSDPQLDGRIGHVTAKGFELYPAVPASVWPTTVPQRGPDHDYDYEHFERPFWDMALTKDNAVWSGRCEYGHIFDGGACEVWSWTRVDKPDGKIVAKIDRAPIELAIPKIPPSKRITLKFVPHVDPVDPDAEPSESDYKPPPKLQMHCVGAGGKIVFPPDEDVDLGMSEKVVWISAEPPIFQADHGRTGYIGYSDYVMFEGCEPSETWKGAVLVGGPHEMLAMFTHEDVSIRWRGREIGKLPGARKIVFAP